MSQTPAISIIAVTDDAPTISTMLDTDDLNLLTSFATTPEAVNYARSNDPDVIVMDYDLLGEAAAEATRTILQHNDKIQVLMLSYVQNVVDIRTAMRAGARDYLIKPLADGELADTIRWLIRERRDYARMSAFMSKLRKAYETMFYDDQPVPQRIVLFLEAQVEESGGERLTLETLAVAYARNREWAKLQPLIEKLIKKGAFTE